MHKPSGLSWRNSKNMLQAKTNCSKLIGMLLSGEKDAIYIAGNGEAVVQLTRIEPKPRKNSGLQKERLKSLMTLKDGIQDLVRSRIICIIT